MKEAKFFNKHELETMALLCDLILPRSDGYDSATDAGVLEFIEFMAKDVPRMQVDLRDGIMWLDHKSSNLFGIDFKSGTMLQQQSILDKISHYDPEIPESERSFEVNFFSLVRNLTITGFHISKNGIRKSGFKGYSLNP